MSVNARLRTTRRIFVFLATTGLVVVIKWSQFLTSDCDGQNRHSFFDNACFGQDQAAATKPPERITDPKVVYDTLTRRLKDKRKDVRVIGDAVLVWDEPLIELIVQRAADVEHISLNDHQATAELLSKLARRLKLKGLGLLLKRDVNRFPLLKEFRSLEYLNLYGSEITDDDLSSLSGMEDLSILQLTKCRCLRGDGLVYLSQCRALQQLNLDETQLTAPAVQSLRGVSSLRVLSLSQTQLSDVELAFLSGMTQLKILNLSRARNVDGSFLQYVKANQLLRTINLEHTMANDDCLGHVVDMPQLTGINLVGTKVTRKGIQWFHSAGGDLGILDWNPPLTCEPSRLEE